MADTVEPGSSVLVNSTIRDVIDEIADRRRMSAGITACRERVNDFSGELEMQLAGIAMVPEARDYMTERLTQYWDEPASRSLAGLDLTGREVIIGGGYHAAVYCASRVRAGFPRPVVLERGTGEAVGGAFAMSMQPVFRLNSRSRPGPAGLPDQDKALNYIPGGIIQPGMLSSEEYSDNAIMAWAIRVTLAQFADVYCGVTVTGINGGPGGSGSASGLSLKTSAGRLLAGRVLDARGCGDAREDAQQAANGTTILTFPQMMARMGRMFPLRGMRQVAVIGSGNSGLCAAESLLGIAPGNSSAIGLDYVTRVDLYVKALPGTSPEQTCSEFRKAQRGRYIRIAQFLRGNKSNPSTRLRIMPSSERAMASALPDGALVRERTYDMAVLATGFRLPVLDDPFGYTDVRAGTGRTTGTGTILARRAFPFQSYRIGPAAGIEFSNAEVAAGVAEVTANRVAMFRLGPRTAALASMLPAPGAAS